MVGDVIDIAEAVEIAPRIWWVGSFIPGDKFQCHVYLIEQGDQSVLIDPGSALIVNEIIRKVDAVVGLDNVRWLVCSHADPDIIGAIPTMIAHGLHPDAAIVTHWRDQALIVHSGTPLPFWRVEEHGWTLPLQDRSLKFLFTPYLHFAGAFTTLDECSGTLFSSDLFGGFTEDRSLFATSVAYFDAIRAFHEHYMPNREILAHAIAQFREFSLERIAPQHGQIIPKSLIVPIMDLLEKLECGIYLLARDDPGLTFLLAANRTLRDVVDTLVREQNFSVVVTFLAHLAGESLGATDLELWSRSNDLLLRFEKGDGYAGHLDEAPPDVATTLAGGSGARGPRMLFALRGGSSDQVNGVLVLGFPQATELNEATLAVLNQIAGLVEVGLEREMLLRMTEIDQIEWHARAIHDTLTGLFNRVSLDDSYRRIAANDDRALSPQTAALMLDIDFFKSVNDKFGHQAGDRVLKSVARSITESVRPSDLVFRFGGEEFLVLLSNVDVESAMAAAQRIRERVASTSIDDQIHLTISIGCALRRRGEGQDQLTGRADEALYRAKKLGRDRVELDL